MALLARVGVVASVGVDAPLARRVVEGTWAGAARVAAEDLPVEELGDAAEGEVVTLVGGGRAAAGTGAMAEGAGRLERVRCVEMLPPRAYHTSTRNLP